MRGLALVLILVCFIAMGFFIGKCTNKPVQNELVLPDVSHQTDQIDSLNRLLKADSATIKALYVTIDSLKVKKVINHKKLNNDIKNVKGLSSVKRDAYIDSIFRADSLFRE